MPLAQNPSESQPLLQRGLDGRFDRHDNSDLWGIEMGVSFGRSEFEPRPRVQLEFVCHGCTTTDIARSRSESYPIVCATKPEMKSVVLELADPPAPEQ